MSSETLRISVFCKVRYALCNNKKCNYKCKKWVLNFLERGGGESGNLVVIGEGRVMICRRVGKEKRVVLASRDGGNLGIP